MDRGSVEELLRGQKVTRSIDLAIEKCQDCNIKQLKSSMDKQLKSSIKAIEELKNSNPKPNHKKNNNNNKTLKAYTLNRTHNLQKLNNS